VASIQWAIRPMPTFAMRAGGQSLPPALLNHKSLYLFEERAVEWPLIVLVQPEQVLDGYEAAEDYERNHRQKKHRVAAVRTACDLVRGHQHRGGNTTQYERYQPN
jgi:hypothetical protein